VKKLTLVMLAATVMVAGCGGSQDPQDTQAAPEGAAPAADAAPAPATATEAPRKSAPAPKPAPAVPTYREVTLPAGTTLPLDLKTALASDTSNVEDAVSATLRSPITVDGREVLPAGTEVVGNVTDVERSGRVKGRAKIAFRFTSLHHAKERYEINTESVAREAEATKGSDAKKIAIGAGAGAAVGALLGGGDGAAKGAAIGGAGGTGVVLATRGKEVRLEPGSDVNTKLTAPLTLRIKVS
jgi:hypothetical protein